MDRLVILLVGPQGSGKTTWCREHLADFLRISQDEQGQREHFHLFEHALERGEPCIVVDRINAQKVHRKRYLDLAKQHGYRTKILWFTVDRQTCLRRCLERRDHPTLAPEEADKAIANYFRSLQQPSRLEADELEILGPPPSYVPIHDMTAELTERRYVIVGDVHGCLDELQELLAQLQFDAAQDVLISVGDLIDRGPKIRETVEFCRGLPHFVMVLGNHDYKLLRYLDGSQVKVASGLRTTIESYGDVFPPDLRGWLDGLPLIVKTPAGYVVHAGFDPEMLPEEQFEDDCLYMRYYGGKTYFDEINGRLWHTLWPADYPRVFFGHIPDPDGPLRDNVVGLDGGCVFGGELRAFDSRDGRVHRVAAKQQYALHEFARTANMSACESLRQREELLIAGLLRGDRSDDGTLAIYTYTDACVYTNAWDDTTRNSRGHIFDLGTGECVAWAFPKFFNLGENRETLPACFDWDGPYEIFEKMDGWLGVLYRHQGVFKVASRGSFHSAGATWATAFLQNFDLGCLAEEVTLCFEIITPEQRIILDYGVQKTLIVLGAFNRFTQDEYTRPQVEEWAQQIGLPVVRMLPHMTLQELQDYQQREEKCEGFVIRFPDGRRVKLKTDWYLQLAKIMSNLTPIAMWEVMHEGKVQETFLRQIPEELRPLAEEYRERLEGQYARLRADAERTAHELLARFGDDRRALALYMNEHIRELGFRRAATFLIRDRKLDGFDKLIRDQIYPRGNVFVRLEDCSEH